ncbi:MAG: hypothetical protein ACJART_000855 [Maribacter sp.]|jgi:hypothetical protein
MITRIEKEVENFMKILMRGISFDRLPLPQLPCQFERSVIFFSVIGIPTELKISSEIFP